MMLPETVDALRKMGTITMNFWPDVSFMVHSSQIPKTWSPKKQALLEKLRAGLPLVNLKIWGAQWRGARQALGEAVTDKYALGTEYAKAMVAAKINIAILSEIRPGASSGDLITARTFEVPGTGAFMLHERTDEAQAMFTEGVDCAMFGSAEELVQKVAYYLAHEEERLAIAAAGRQRSIDSGYSYDDRARVVIDKARELAQEKQSARRPA